MAGGEQACQSLMREMQGPCWQSTGAHNVRAHCNLLQQLSQDLLDKTPAELNTGCDSSDCLFCQGQRQFCNQAITNSVCDWLGRRLSSNADRTSNSQASAAGPQGSAGVAPQHHQEQLQDSDEQQEQRKRLRLSPASTPACSSATCTDEPAAFAAAAFAAAAAAATSADGAHGNAAAEVPHSDLQQQLRAGMGCPPHGSEQVHNPAEPGQEEQLLPQTSCGTAEAAAFGVQEASSPCLFAGHQMWQWQPEFAGYVDPAPARLAEVARLQPAADAAGGHCVGRCDRISGLEFSPDGQLLAAAGISKQVGLYPLAALAELQDAAGDNPCAVPGCRSSCSRSQRQQRSQQQRMQQPQQAVPLLPPVATVRLPGKVSSIAFSPDMQGVISIGDYDGTLTQVHVASGHYLNEVDAHAGRRIWSISHSKLRRQLAVTASDDCTARLWSGIGLDTCVATVMAPGKPAVCGADFSSSNEFLLALAAADAKVYLYDLRQLQQPLATLHGHRRPVSYAKFFGQHQLVSASIDGTLAAWDLSAVLGLTASPTAAAANSGAASWTHDGAVWPSPASSACCSSVGGCAVQQQVCQGGPAAVCASAAGSNSCSREEAGAASAVSSQQQQPWKVFKGHKNERNFVGLAVQASSGLIAVGSETSEVFSYHTSWSSPLARFDMARPQELHKLASNGVHEQLEQSACVDWAPAAQQQQPQSVSAVAWQPPCGGGATLLGGASYGPATLLAAATSSGACRLLTMVHP